MRLTALFSAMGILLVAAVAIQAQQRPPAPVVVAPVVERAVAAGQTFVGTVQPLRRSIVGSAVAGRVIEYFINEGDRVKKDQPLAQLRLDALQIQRAAAMADLELRKQELTEMLNGSRPEEIDQAKARAAGAKALMEYRQSRLKRIQELIEKRAASTDEFQDASSAAEQAVAAYLDARKAYELTVAGPRKEKIAQAQARVDAGKEAVLQIDDQIREHTIVSPFDGYVVAENTEVGQWISAADPVAEVIEVDQVEIAIPLLEDYVSHLKIGQKVRVELAALNGKQLEGVVALIVPQADVRSRTFPVKVRVQNEFIDGRPVIKPGMLARVSLPVGTASTALLVPKDAIVLGGATPVVYAVAPGKTKDVPTTARLVPVQLGVVEGNLIEVKGDLKAGDQVVFQGNERLMPGAPVSVLPDAPARQAAN